MKMHLREKLSPLTSVCGRWVAWYCLNDNRTDCAQCLKIKAARKAAKKKAK